MKKFGPIIAALFLATGCLEDESRTNDASAAREEEPTAELVLLSNVEAGGAVADWCADCHGDNGVSTTRHIPHLSGQRMTYVVNELKAYKEGVRDDPAMHVVAASLTEEAMRNVAAYYSLRSTGDGGVLESSGSPETDLPEVAPSVARWTVKCDRCHAGNGFADPGRFPILTGQRQEYLVRTMHAYQNRFLRSSSMMHAMTEQLNPKEIQDIAAYYARGFADEMVGPASQGHRPAPAFAAPPAKCRQSYAGFRIRADNQSSQP